MTRGSDILNSPGIADVSGVEDDLSLLIALSAMIAADRERINSTEIDLDQAAGSYTLFTASQGDSLIESVSFRLPNVDVSDDAVITGISIQINKTTPTVFISAVAGAKANLPAEAELSWDGPAILKNGEEIQLTICGGPADAETICDVVVKSKRITGNAELI